jgi:5-methylcytosine-specific restriction endonuclease McrA
MPELHVCIGCGALTERENVTAGRCPTCTRRRAPQVAASKRRGPEAEARRRNTPAARLYNSRAWRQVRRAVLERDHWTCRYCRKPADTVDHVVPLSRGGAPLDTNNLVACCRSCNGRKGNKTRKVAPLG